MNRNGSIGSAQWALRPTFGDHVAQAARALQRWLAAGWRRGAAPPTVASAADDLETLAELDARVLHDIGAPEPLQSRARDRHDASRRRWDEREVGFVPGDWSRW